MPNYHAQVILHTNDAIPENFVSNTFSIVTNTGVTIDSVGCTAAIKGFYDHCRRIRSVRT